LRKRDDGINSFFAGAFTSMIISINGNFFKEMLLIEIN